MKWLNTSQRLLLVLAVVNFVIGIPVSLMRVQISPAWTIALPVGVVCLGLFLLSCIWHGEMLKFDEDERLRIESARRRWVSSSKTTKKSPLKSPKPIWSRAAEAGASGSAACNSTKEPL